jgi:hypothetical protein
MPSMPQSPAMGRLAGLAPILVQAAAPRLQFAVPARSPVASVSAGASSQPPPSAL